MGFFQDLKQDLSQTVNDLGTEEAVTELNLDEGATASEDIFGSDLDTDFSDLEAMLEKGVAELDDSPVNDADKKASDDIDVEAMFNEIEGNSVASEAEGISLDTAKGTDETVEDTEASEILQNIETAAENTESSIPVVEENSAREVDTEMEKLLNEVEQNIQEPSYMDAVSAASQENYETDVAVSTDTAVITEGMSITGDVTSSGNMDLIGNITGNIDILGKLNVTGSITGNSSAAEIYAESAQINGEIRSKGSVKIGQSSVVIGDIFATSAVIAGAVKGDIDVHGPVILDTSAIVMGNIKSKSVQINNGAVIEGMCSQCYADVSPSSFFNDVKKNRK
jgi:cytoskeletal protein CcmA (bactofilin family)